MLSRCTLVLPPRTTSQRRATCLFRGAGGATTLPCCEIETLCRDGGCGGARPRRSCSSTSAQRQGARYDRPEHLVRDRVVVSATWTVERRRTDHGPSAEPTGARRSLTPSKAEPDRPPCARDGDQLDRVLRPPVRHADHLMTHGAELGLFVQGRARGPPDSTESGIHWWCQRGAVHRRLGVHAAIDHVGEHAGHGGDDPSAPPGAPSTRLSWPWSSTIAGDIELSGRLPGAMALAAPWIRP